MTSSPDDSVLRGITCLVLDADGVLTPGWIVQGPGGEWKVFDVQDGHGVRMWRRAGHRVAIVSGRESGALERRADDLGVDILAQGVRDKARAFDDVRGRLGVGAAEIAAVGDDLPDLPMLERAGIGVAVPNACPEVLAAADWVTRARGGAGAVREIIERILKAQGAWDGLVQRYREGL